MNIFLTGATGYIGSSVLPALTKAGHTVTALVRTDAAAESVRAEGVTPVVGTLTDTDTIRSAAAAADAVVHTASPGDETSNDVENAFADAVLAGLRSGSAFVRTGGVWVHGSGENITETTPRSAPTLVAWREAIDTRVLETDGIRAVLIEPGIVYGHGKGIAGLLVGADTTDEGELVLIGDGTQHWTTVHVDDLAHLYVAAVEKAEHGSTFIGAGGVNPTVAELGTAASTARGLGGKVKPESTDSTVGRLGAFGEALLLDQQASGAHARSALDWQPTGPTLIEEIENGSYTPR